MKSTSMIIRAAFLLLLAIGQTAWAQQYTVSTMAYPNIADAVQVSLDNQNWSSSITASAGGTVYFKLNIPIGYDLHGYSIEHENGFVSYSNNDFTMPNSNVTISAYFDYSPTGSSISYTATLSPGNGTGNSIVYYFDPESAAPNASSANNCQFYYVNYNTIGYRLLDSYCPDTFIAPQSLGFSGWNPSGDITLSLGNTTFTAQWSSRYFHLSPDALTLNGAGYTSITVKTDELAFDGAEHLYITFSAGTLSKGTETIPFYVYSNVNAGSGSSWSCVFDSPGERGFINVYITNDAYNAAAPGTYMGMLNYTSEWDLIDDIVNGKSGSIVLTLAISEFTKEITGYGTGSGGWRLIASPLAGTTNVENVNNLINTTTPANYDLYRFNQTATKEWENYKVHHSDSENPFNALVNGQGYLYANANTTTLTFRGTPYSGNGQVRLNKTENASLGEWNLIGNPFSTAATLDKPFYRMNTEGKALSAQVEANNSVAVMEGVFVQASTNNETTTFTQVNNSKGGEKNDVPMLNINLTRNHGEAIDNAIIRFDGGQTLDKFTLHEDDSQIYIPQNGKEYAIATAETTDEMLLNFKASENSTYTISANVEGLDLEYLHLIDNLTGVDVDLLVEPTYTFEGKTTDYASRFKLVFNPNLGDTTDDNFAFVSDGQLIVNGEGYLQVIDALGRQLLFKELSTPNSSLLTPNFSTGVYVLRLISGENVRTQKIVIQ